MKNYLFLLSLLSVLGNECLEKLKGNFILLKHWTTTHNLSKNVVTYLILILLLSFDVELGNWDLSFLLKFKLEVFWLYVLPWIQKTFLQILYGVTWDICNSLK